MAMAMTVSLPRNKPWLARGRRGSVDNKGVRGMPPQQVVERHRTGDNDGHDNNDDDNDDDDGADDADVGWS
eukprot:9314920-Pyramimonas_sp.AAC.1